MTNPFRKYLTKEDLHQEAVMDFFKLQYPKALVIHVPNEGKRSKFEQFKAQVLGIKAGVSDVLCFQPVGGCNGLAIELKECGNDPTDKQEEFMYNLKKCGWDVYVSYSSEESVKIIRTYFAGESQKQALIKLTRFK